MVPVRLLGVRRRAPGGDGLTFCCTASSPDDRNGPVPEEDPMTSPRSPRQISRVTWHIGLALLLLPITAGPVAAWPHVFNDEIHSSPMVADLAGDGTLDVIVLTTDGMLNVLGPDDSPTNGWPRQICGPSTIADGQNWVAGSAAVVDLDGDQALEILQAGFDGTLHALSAMGVERPGFPIQMGTYSTDTPTVSDLDGDGDLEIICRYQPDAIAVWSHTGQMLPGWPQTAVNAPGGAIDVWSCACTADLDGDGDLEIVFGDYSGAGRAFHHDGTVVPGWPVNLNPDGTYTGWVLSSPAAADLDGDGRDEIVIGSDDDRLWVLRGTGANVPGWPKVLPFGFRSSPAIGDLDGDGDLEIVIGQRTNTGNLLLYAFRQTGVLVAGWPISLPPGAGGYTFGWLSPLIADLTGDGRPEVIAVKERSTSNPNQCEIYAYGPNGGAPLPGFPIALQSLAYGMPTVADFDGDGLAEILIGDLSCRLYKVDLTQSLGPAQERTDWRMFQKDLRHTGRVMTVDPQGAPDGGGPVDGRVRVVQAYPNPFARSVALRLVDVVSSANGGWTVHDLTGRQIRRIAGASTARWDGLADDGAIVAPGIYFVRAPSGVSARVVRTTR